jgi:hypothetical protein
MTDVFSAAERIAVAVQKKRIVKKPALRKSILIDRIATEEVML